MLRKRIYAIANIMSLLFRYIVLVIACLKYKQMSQHESKRNGLGKEHVDSLCNQSSREIDFCR